MRTIKTWIVLANRKVARIFEREGISHAANVVATCRNSEMKTGKVTYEAPLGRVFDSHGPARHSVEPRHNQAEQDQTQFAKKIAKILEIYATKKRFDRLVIISEPQVLGELRRAYGKKTASLITKEIDKDVVNLNQNQVLELLE